MDAGDAADDISSVWSSEAPSVPFSARDPLWWNDDATPSDADFADSSQWWVPKSVGSRRSSGDTVHASEPSTLLVLGDVSHELHRAPLTGRSIHTLNLATAFLEEGGHVHLITPYRQHSPRTPTMLRPLQEHERCHYHDSAFLMRQIVSGEYSLRQAWSPQGDVCHPLIFVEVVRYLCRTQGVTRLVVRDAQQADPHYRIAEAILRGFVDDRPSTYVLGLNPFSQLRGDEGATLVWRDSRGHVPPLVREMASAPRALPPADQPMRLIYAGRADPEYIWWVPRLALALSQLERPAELYLVFSEENESCTFRKVKEALRVLPWVKWFVGLPHDQCLRLYEECDLGLRLSSGRRQGKEALREIADRELQSASAHFMNRDLRAVRELAVTRMLSTEHKGEIPTKIVEMASRALPILMDRNAAHQSLAGHGYPLYLSDTNVRTLRETIHMALTNAGVYARASRTLLEAARHFTIARQVERFHTESTNGSSAS